MFELIDKRYKKSAEVMVWWQPICAHFSNKLVHLRDFSK